MLEQGDVIQPLAPASLLENAVRILRIDEELDAVTVISLQRRSKEGNARYYIPLPSTVQLSLLRACITSGEVSVCQFECPPHWSMSDEDYLAAPSSEKEQGYRVYRIRKREEAFREIEPYIKNLSIETVIRCIDGILIQIRTDFGARGKNCAAAIRFLCLYVMSLGRRNSLMPRTDRCGAPGKERTTPTPTGRPRIDGPAKNYAMTQEDKERCALGMQLRSAGKLISEAYLECCNTFWSDRVVDEFGNLTVKLWDVGMRPSMEQFSYWGAKGRSKIRLKLFSTIHIDRPTKRDGSPSEDIHAVGVLGEFDSTGSDVYLTSVTSRTKTLPPMKRYLIKCPRTKAILGFHVDWAAPSPRLALRTILAAAEDKHELCKKYGIDCPPGEWPGVFISSYRVDNGEMKAQEITDAEKEFGFQIEYTKSRTGEWKPNVESQHKSDHVAFDHRLPGTTRGRQKKRGETDPAKSALLNFHEYMSGLLEHYLDHNRTLVPDLAPLEMIREGIPPTRMNIFKWYLRTHQSSVKRVDIQNLRSFTLPKWPAVLSEEGIQLKSECGKKTITSLRYSSAELRSDARFLKACSKRRRYNIDVRVDTNDVSRIYVPLSVGMCEIPNVAPVDDYRLKTGLADLIVLNDEKLAIQRASRHEGEQEQASAVFARGQVETNALAEKRRELRQVRKGDPTKNREKSKSSPATRKQDSLRENARAESAMLIADSTPAVAYALATIEAGVPIDAQKNGPGVGRERNAKLSVLIAEINAELGHDN